ncbi:MAG TPA: hypothetical protein P5110_08815 [Candidatus Omnitrophota bacterium]|nr:hypothetical protein [Candidatus Omnitrophota bacterium]HRZ15592.1 hypothetical protein [Candidatus Omnitrophota bacterium]
MSGQSGKGFLTFILIIACIALFLRFFIVQIIRINSAQNEANALETLKLMSTAIENYSRDHLSSYPSSISMLLKSEPAYIDKDYVSESVVKGYSFSCPRLETSGYSCYAEPVKCQLSGTKQFTVTTGGVIVSEDCDKKE